MSREYEGGGGMFNASDKLLVDIGCEGECSEYGGGGRLGIGTA